MKSIEILARFEGDEYEKGCGRRECMTAYEAVIAEIEESPADTRDAIEISAVDDDMNVAACRCDEGWEIHIYVGENDWYFMR